MNPRLIAAKPLAYARCCRLMQTASSACSMSRLNMDKGIFSQLRDAAVFARVKVVSGRVEWPGGQHFSPDTLYLRSQPVDEAQAT